LAAGISDRYRGQSEYLDCGDASGSLPNTVILDSNVLSRFGAESLIIGGKRTNNSGLVSLMALATSITVRRFRLSVDISGYYARLQGRDRGRILF